MKTKKILLNVVLILLGLAYLFPVYIIVVNAFKNRAELYENILAFPKDASFKYFTKAMDKMDFSHAFMNSMIVTCISLVFIVVLTSMCAWMLARNDGKLSKFIFMMFVATMLIPFQTLMMPLLQVLGFFRDYCGIQLTDTLGGLIFCYIGFGTGMSVFLFHGFIKSVPVEVEEAAIIDGCSKLGVFFKIVFPMLKPVTMTVIILNVIWIWNDYLLPSLILYSKKNRTIPLSTANFFGQYTVQWNLAMAGLTLTIIPVVIFYLCAQKYIIKGIAAGAVK
ncbi:MAG: carbohydrate ABC transporter permease [Lachnospiraceae bacterium]|nr:carbohydrate ABC transporter permease [Lachnospiraceae bacterium]